MMTLHMLWYVTGAAVLRARDVYFGVSIQLPALSQDGAKQGLPVGA